MLHKKKDKSDLQSTNAIFQSGTNTAEIINEALINDMHSISNSSNSSAVNKILCAKSLPDSQDSGH